MSAMKRELIKLSICIVIGVLLGLVYGSLIGFDNGRIFLWPFLGSLFSVGWVYGLPWVFKLLKIPLKISGTGLMNSILSLGRGNRGCPWGAILVLLFGLQLLSLALMISWLPGVVLAGKALWNAYNNTAAINAPYTTDDWDDKYFEEKPKKREKMPWRSKNKELTNYNGEDDFHW